MWKIWIHDKDSVKELLTDQKISYQTYAFEIKDKQMIVLSEKEKIPLTSGKTRLISGHVIHCVDRESQSWFAYPLKENLLIGRAVDADLRFLSDTVSNHHFSIRKEEGYVLYDHDSTNGTYVNGRRVTSAPLQSGDQIYFADVEGYIVKDYLILSCKRKGYCQIEIEPLSSVEDVLPIIKPVDITVPLLQSYEMELPQLQSKPKKTNLFQAVGSSMLILVSGIASALVMRLFSPDNQERVIMMLMTSGSMCLAFLLYGVFNREIQWKDKCKEAKNDEAEYLQYVQSCERELDQLKNAYQMKIVSIVDLYRTLPDTTFESLAEKEIFLCPGLLPKKWISIQTGRSGYQYHKNDLYLYLQTVIKNWSSPLMTPAFIQAGTKNQVCFYDSMYLFIEWCWLFWNPSRKWIWIVPDEKLPDAFTAFEGCLEDHTRLIIKEESDIGRIQKIMDEKKQYVIYSQQDALLQKLCAPENSIVLKGAVHSSFQTIDHIYDPIQKFTSFQRYRRLHQKQKITFEDVFGKDPKPADRVNLEIVLGVDDKNQTIRFDLSEYGDGPHGFIAGMTGSGKSELISSLLMQLVLNNDPEHLQYLIIDFKGGAFGQAFYRFAHCAGMLTNLEREELFRFQKGIRFELERRQRLLQEFTAKYSAEPAHIDAYNEKMPKCISHLFIIVDELAQLKAEAPDFMAGLKEIARVGRSLGIHCLLSTQKPLGIIDDQILANSRFKICLAVSSKADSQEVLHHDKAFYLSQPGTFILQIQNRENEYIGKSFWLHQNMENSSNQWIEVNDKDEMICQSKDTPAMTVNQYYSQRVFTLYPYHKYVIPAFNQSLFQERKDVLAIIDNPLQNQQTEWDISFGQSVVILTRKLAEIHQMVSTLRSFHHGHPLYTAAIDQCICDFPSLSHLASVETITDQCTILLSVPTLSRLSSILPVIFHKNVRLFCFVSEYDPHDRSILHSFTERICLDGGNIDELRSFFELFLPVSTKPAKEKGMIRKDDKIFQILFQKVQNGNTPPMGNVFRYKKESKGYYVGTYQRKKVYWQAGRKLVVCYAQKSKKETIEKMIEGWQAYRDFTVSHSLKEPFDICVINMIHDLDTINSPLYKEMMYDLDVMWIGEGFEDYCFYLKKKPNPQWKGRNYLWQQDEVYPFERYEKV